VRRAIVQRIVVVCLWGLAACSDDSAANAPPDAGGETDAAVASEDLLRFDEDAARSFNDAWGPADPEQVCGAADRRFLAELLGEGGSPLDYKVPKRLADVKQSPSQVVVAGEVVRSKLGAGDFPFDHTMGSDFNADVLLDGAYRGAGQENAETIDTLHIELAAGQLPHRESSPSPADQDWRAMRDHALDDVQDGFVPQAGDRVLVMGNWIVDCGHTNFQTEIHPITFMAVARIEGDATVVHAFYNPYRETQLYHPDPDLALAFEDADRLTLPDTKPFPAALIQSLLRVQDAAPEPYPTSDRLESWALLEPNTTSPVALRVCAPGAPGKATVGARFVTRPGVEVTLAADGETGCADVDIRVGDAEAGKPDPHRCTTPWDFLSEVAQEEVGGEERAADAGMLDLKQQIGMFVAAEFQDRLDLDPVMNCYDPLAGPDLGDTRPDDVDIGTDPDVLLPLYGTLVVRVAGD